MKRNQTTDICFRDLQNYTTLKQVEKVVNGLKSFRDLQNYTTLKHIVRTYKVVQSFRDLQNYTTLKPQIKFVTQE